MIAPANFSPLSTDRGKTANIDRAATSRLAATLDAELVHRFNGGEEQAFAEITTRHRERMFSVAFAMLRNNADAEEIVQDTFIRAYRGLATFRGDSSLATWLHRIALNLARNRYWYFFRRRRHLSISIDSPLGHDSTATFSDRLATNDVSPAHAAVTDEFTELIARCVERLSAPQRAILLLRNSLNRSYEEIAQELGIRVGTVKSRIARARSQLRLNLAEICPEFGSDAKMETWFDPIRGSGEAVAMCA